MSTKIEWRAFFEGMLASDRYLKARLAARSYRCPVEPDDLEAELGVGMLEHVRTVDMKRGDPMEYLIARGMWRVKRVVRKALNHSIIEECLICGKVRPYRQEPCSKCHGRNFLIHPRYLPLLIDESGLVLREPGRAKPKMRGGVAAEEV